MLMLELSLSGAIQEIQRPRDEPQLARIEPTEKQPQAIRARRCKTGDQLFGSVGRRNPDNTSIVAIFGSSNQPMLDKPIYQARGSGQSDGQQAGDPPHGDRAQTVDDQEGLELRHGQIDLQPRIGPRANQVIEPLILSADALD
jgi:hypothetical protein